MGNQLMMIHIFLYFHSYMYDCGQLLFYLFVCLILRSFDSFVTHRRYIIAIIFIVITKRSFIP